MRGVGRDEDAVLALRVDVVDDGHHAGERAETSARPTAEHQRRPAVELQAHPAAHAQQRNVHGLHVQLGGQGGRIGHNRDDGLAFFDDFPQALFQRPHHVAVLRGRNLVVARPNAEVGQLVAHLGNLTFRIELISRNRAAVRFGLGQLVLVLGGE